MLPVDMQTVERSWYYLYKGTFVYLETKYGGSWKNNNKKNKQKNNAITKYISSIALGKG